MPKSSFIFGNINNSIVNFYIDTISRDAKGLTKNSSNCQISWNKLRSRLAGSIFISVHFWCAGFDLSDYQTDQNQR